MSLVMNKGRLMGFNPPRRESLAIVGRMPAWGSAFKGVGLGSRGSAVMGRTDTPQVLLNENTYYDGLTWRYSGNGAGAVIMLNGGAISILNAPVGVAGNPAVVTDRIDVDINGNILFNSLAGVSATGDITAQRVDGTGVLFLGSTGARFLSYDGTRYTMPGASLLVNNSAVLTAASAVNATTLNNQNAAFYTDIPARLGFTPYNATNPAGYITNVVASLGYTPYNATNPAGYISSVTQAAVLAAIGYTPYNVSNPAGYIGAAGLAAYAPLAGAAFTGNVSFVSFNATPRTFAVNTTLIASDMGSGLIHTDQNTAHTITIPPSSSVAFPIGTRIPVTEYNQVAGHAVNVARGAGVLLYDTMSGGTNANKACNPANAGSPVAFTLVKFFTEHWTIIAANGTVVT